MISYIHVKSDDWPLNWEMRATDLFERAKHVVLRVRFTSAEVYRRLVEAVPVLGHKAPGAGRLVGRNLFR